MILAPGRRLVSYIGVLLSDLGFVVASLLIAVPSIPSGGGISEISAIPVGAFAGLVGLSAVIMVAIGLPGLGASDANGRVTLRTAATSASLTVIAVIASILSGYVLPPAMPLTFAGSLFTMMTISRAFFTRLVPVLQQSERAGFVSMNPPLLTVERFLGRAEVGGDVPGRLETYAGKSVLVSGAGGSIGSELCKQLINHVPARLILFDLSEAALFAVHRALRQSAADAGVDLISVLGSVTDATLVAQILAQQSVDIVLHAAAYKHVSLVQQNPLAGLANNALGTHVLVTAAVQAGVERFILISSDKAMCPRGVMGASKRLAELIVLDIASRISVEGPILSMVRFGNVLGSSGSVVPIFQDQISRGGPVTVTDPRATRYFMTLAEAGRLVLHSGSMSRGGEVFVLDMGKPVRIQDLAMQAIVAAGRTIQSPQTTDGEIAVKIVGLSDGENLHERSLCDGTEEATAHDRIFQLHDAGVSEFEVAELLRAVRNSIANGQPEEAFAALARRIPEFRDPTTTDESMPLAHLS